MIYSQPQIGSFGWSITSPFKAVAHAATSTVKVAGKGVVAAGKGVATGAQAVGHGAVVGTKAVGHGVVVGAKTAGKGALVVGKLALKPAEWIAHVAMTPVRNRVHSLRDRRANKIAWDKRKSRTPTPAERAEASAWTKSHLKSKGPHGQVLALFAGAPIRMLTPYETAVQLGDPVTASVVSASVPVLIALINSIMGKADKSGEAPANIGPDGKAIPAKPDAPGTVDVTPVQEAVDSAAEDAAADAGTDSPGGGSSAAMVKLPGVGAVNKKHLLIGGAVVGGLVLLSVLLPRRHD